MDLKDASAYKSIGYRIQPVWPYAMDMLGYVVCVRLLIMLNRGNSGALYLFLPVSTDYLPYQNRQLAMLAILQPIGNRFLAL